MSEDKKERRLPIRSLHEFLFEISEAWDGFRTGSMITMIVSAILIVLLTPRLLVLHFQRGDFVESVIYLAIIIGLSYNFVTLGSNTSFTRSGKSESESSCMRRKSF